MQILNIFFNNFCFYFMFLLFDFENVRQGTVECVLQEAVEVFCGKVVLRNFTKFTGKHLCQSLSPATLKRDSGTGFFL